MLQLGFEKTLKTPNWYRLPLGLHKDDMNMKWKYDYDKVMKNPASLSWIQDFNHST